MSATQSSHQVLDTHAVEMQIENFLDNFKKNYAEWETTAHQHDTNSREVKDLFFALRLFSCRLSLICPLFGQICFQFLKTFNLFDVSFV